MSKITRLRHNSNGIVSIMMTIVMMLVISLIILGLAQISRREQRVTTDNQLSAQAFYAAESGVNDVEDLMRTYGVVDKPDCTSTASPYNLLQPVIDSTADISYSCVLVEPSPSTITADFSTTPSVYSLVTTAAAGLNSLTLSWTPEGSVDDAASCPTTAISSASTTNLFPPSWPCHYGVLRVDLVDASSLTRNALVSGARTYFLVPNRSGNTSSGNPLIVGATCSGGLCKAVLSGLPASNTYYARISSVYHSGTANICAGAGACDSSVKFANYATIDVTGKAQDVLKRIKVTKDLSGGNQNSHANAAIMSGSSICKRFKLNPTGTATGDYAGFSGC